MKAKLTILFTILLVALNTNAANKFNYCKNVAAPQDFILQLQFDHVPNLIDFTLQEDYTDLNFEVHFSPEVEIDALRCQSSNSQQFLLLNRRWDRSEPQFPNLLKAINSQYELQACRIPKPSYYHFLFRLYPF